VRPEERLAVGLYLSAALSLRTVAQIVRPYMPGFPSFMGVLQIIRLIALRTDRALMTEVGAATQPGQHRRRDIANKPT